MMVQFKISCLLIDTTNDQPVLMLQEMDGSRAIPIVIGLAEAGAIASELEHVQFPRPMTHDLLRATVERLGARMVHMVVNDLRNNTFFARIVLDRQGEQIEVDSRPSDAIALAVRCGAPIFADERVVDMVAVSAQAQAEAEEAVLNVPEERDPESLRRFLEDLRPDDFGKYKM